MNAAIKPDMPGDVHAGLRPGLPPDPRAHRRYLRWMLGTIAGASAAVAGFVLLVDPYGLYALADIRGFNRVKPPVERYRNEIRLARAERFQPAIVIAGNSRMEVGVDPEGPHLAGSNAFNLALAGTSTEKAVEQLRHLGTRSQPPRRVIAGMEFVDVLTERPVHPAAAAPLAAAAPAGWRTQLWRADTLFSFASLKDAVLTVAIQHQPHAAMATLRGHNPLLQYHQAAATEGYAALFSQRAAENTRKLAATAGGGLHAAAVRSQVAALIDVAADADPGVAIDLVIYPYHAQLLALFERASLWPRFEAWKEILVEQAEAGRRRHPGARIAVHDFSGFGPIQCEAVPAPGSKARTRWYWEAGHFKPALGELIMARVLSSADPRIPAGFGFALERNTLVANRARIAHERAACVAAQAALFDGVARDVQRELTRRGALPAPSGRQAAVAGAPLPK
ncbi:hypothetical protein [Pseudoduganella umbonata]|uniref:Uncharacterized protein n=1 Tax=Pseudoduganella umbonata TaxID=864828 RepID=A0A4P8HMN2_9BURK|nr:hypothetical protein [Pseudoduganella umbonata]MBB3219570.1 hypothetical protein [Pseudoduganella umbonata]QCP09642.1 hypothetical protein FCL38_03800 [Pseudoduganella umbonata]